ncbi:glycoside hydrolase family 61 protein, partial [Serendipita vermifera MAFF 305830]
AAYDGSGGWFKIYQVTAVTNGGTSITWPTDNATQFTFKIPSSISAGNYLLRIEHIALHSASSTAGAQVNLDRCAQLTVTGGGSASPATVSIPGIYSATDPGILINIYWPIVSTYLAFIHFTEEAASYSAHNL